MGGGTTAGQVDTRTVLFTDLVGSTQLRTEIGEEASDRLRLVHDALVSGAIESAGGSVIKSTGDGVMATFSGAADAVRAAVAVQQAIHRHNRRGEGPELAVRIGLSVGDVTVEDDGDCFGLPVVEAQRLEGAAQPGQILAASLVRGLARGRGDHQFRSVGDLELKGLAEPLSADEVLWEPLDDPQPDGPGLPPLLVTGAAFSFAGRDRELAVLTDAWKATLEGPGQLVLLAGEPGIGKTRLVTELAKKVLDDGGMVVAGRCDEDLASPYGPVAAALAWAADQGGPGVELGEWPDELTRLAPELADLVPGLETAPGADADPALLIRAIRSWLERTAAATPVLLVLDDLHWADAATLLVVRSLFDRTPVARLLVVGTYRDTDLDRRHPLAATLADLRRHDRVTRVSVEGLTEDGVVDFLTAAASGELDEAGRMLAQAVWAETSGNPFFVGEILRHLAETGAIVQRDGQWTSDIAPADFGIPEGIREVVGRRLTRLGDEAERVLSTAAVVGLDFDVDVVAQVLGSPADDVLDALEQAQAAALVTEQTSQRWRFAHGIVRETLLEELSSSRRVRQHRKVAAAIEATTGDPDAAANQLAYHWGEAAAGGGDLEKALAWGARAGDLALAKSALEDAIRWYEQTLGLLDPDDPLPAEECDLLVRLARAQSLNEDGSHRAAQLRAADLALQLGDHAQLTAAVMITPRVGYSEDEAGADHELLDRLEQAAEVIGADEPALRAEVLAALALELQFLGQGDRRGELCHEAYRLAQESGDRDARFAAIVAAFYSLPLRLATREDFTKHNEALLEMRDGVLAEGDPHQVLQCLQLLWYFAMIMSKGELARSVEAIDDELLDRRPTPLLVRSVVTRRVLRALIGGEVEMAQTVLDHAELTDKDVIQDGGRAVLRYCMALEGGWAPATVPGLETAVETVPQRRFVEAMLALALVEAGEHERAAALFDAAMADGIGALPDDTLWGVTICLWMEVGVLLGGAARGEALQAWEGALADWEHCLNGAMYLGPVARLRGGVAHLLGDDDAAVALFTSAIAAGEAVEAVPMLAATRTDWGRLLLDQGDRAGAEALARAALADLGDRDLPRQRRRAEALLADLALG